MIATNSNFLRKIIFSFFFLFSISISIFSQNYTEGFDVVVPLPTGWASQNLSTPIGIVPNWFQGSDAVFPAQSGPTTSYAGVNYNSTAGNNTISNWLFTPNRTYNNGDVFTFYTRTVDVPSFPDRLQVRLSLNGASVNAGATSTSVGDFSTLLLDINPTLITTGYPNTWTQYTITISGLGAPTSGRIAFRYFVTSGGPNGANSDYIGIDNVTYTVGSPCSMTASAVVASNFNGSQISCFGFSDGVLNASPSGGTAPYSYLWSNGTSIANNTNLADGSYVVTITDATGCTASTSAALMQPAAITPSATVANVSCNGGNNGSIDLTVSGGTGGYSYMWSNGPTTEDVSNLVSGTYGVTVTDDNGCITTTSAMVTEPVTANYTFIGPGSDFNVSVNWQGGCVPPMNNPTTIITINSGQTLIINGNLTATIINNGTLSGTVILNGSITNNGTVSPGN